MGQAKQRGTFEQRKEEAIELRKILDAEREKQRAKVQINVSRGRMRNSEVVGFGERGARTVA